MAKKTFVLLGTRRGVFVGKSDLTRKKFAWKGPYLAGSNIFCAVRDPRNGWLYAGANNAHWGPAIQYSKDMGKTWVEAKVQPRFAADSKASVEAVWQIEPDTAEHPGCLYAGVAPAALFRSEDFGETWTELTGLSTHETRPKWNPGNGGLCLHSILVDPRDGKHLLAAISAVGVFESFDRGVSWKLVNTNLSVFNPEDKDGPCSCIHKIAFAAGNPDRIYQQNHVGVFKREGQAGWTPIEKGLPSNFGFPMVAHPSDPDCAYVIPLKGGENRAPIGGKLAVYRTRDAGKNWKPLRRGLPSPSYVGILRDAFASDGLKRCGLYFGTTAGEVFTSHNEGDKWSCAATRLPGVNSVRAFAV